MSESKKERFIRIAENRTNRIIKDLNLLGNCSNKVNYDYSPEEVRQIFDAIDSCLREVKARYKIQDEIKVFKIKSRNGARNE